MGNENPRSNGIEVRRARLGLKPTWGDWSAQFDIDFTGVEAEIVKVTDYGEIVSRGVMSTPGLAIDGEVKSTGRIPSAGDIAEWLVAS